MPQSLTSGPTVGSKMPSLSRASSRPRAAVSAMSLSTGTGPDPARSFSLAKSEAGSHMFISASIRRSRSKQASKFSSDAWPRRVRTTADSKMVARLVAPAGEQPEQAKGVSKTRTRRERRFITEALYLSAAARARLAVDKGGPGTYYLAYSMEPARDRLLGRNALSYFLLSRIATTVAFQIQAIAVGWRM